MIHPEAEKNLNGHKSTDFQRLDTPMLEKLRSIVGEAHCCTDQERLTENSRDKTAMPLFMPEVVVVPGSVDEISAVLQCCNKWQVPVTVRGGGSGLAGGAVPVHGGVVLSMQRFDRILHLDEANLQVTVEPGVITETLQNTLKEKGLFYPPDPSSKGWSHIGGNVSTNAGGPRAVKYGVVREYVLNLQVVLADGSIIWTGANTLKNSTGYNLTQLIVGSEGTLGVVTKIVLRLLPYPTHNLLLLAPFTSAQRACEAVSAVFRAGITPSTLEFMERHALEKAIEYVGSSPVPLQPDHEAHLLIEVDGFHPDVLYTDCEAITQTLEAFGCAEVFFADNDTQKNSLWSLRRNMSHAIKQSGVFHSEDTVVPRAALPQLLAYIHDLGAQYGFKSYCYGHAGDGNLHVNILPGSMTTTAWEMELPKAIRQLFIAVKALGGTISGEHGIGYIQRPYLDIVFSEVERGLRQQIKAVFDPKGILNPGKVV
jgi:glycolate oxidase